MIDTTGDGTALSDGTAAADKATAAEETAAAGQSAKSASVQVTAALVFGVVVLAGICGVAVFGDPPTSGQDGKPAACNPPKDSDSPEYPALCAALNRPDLPVLLGTPTEHVSIAQSGGGPITYADGTKELDASAQVQLGQVCVKITDNADLPVKVFTTLPGPAQLSTTVLGHPAVTYTDHTLAFAFGGGKTTTGTGGLARHLVVAKDPADGGGSYELAVWRQDDVTPDAAALVRIAEQVLPTAPGWTG